MGKKRRGLKRRCKFCKKIYLAADGKGNYCYSCKELRRECRCGCGGIIVGAHKQYLCGHAMKDLSNLKVKQGHKNQGQKISGENNPSKRSSVRKKVSVGVLASWARPSVRRRHSKAITAALATPSARRNLKRAAALRAVNSHSPNLPERKLAGILGKEFPKQFRINVGPDGAGVVIGSWYCPDFVHACGLNLVVEMFGTYWHGKKRTGRTRRQEEIRRRKIFYRYGFKTCIIWEDELDNDLVVAKIKKSLEGCHVVDQDLPIRSVSPVIKTSRTLQPVSWPFVDFARIYRRLSQSCDWICHGLR